jgi:hypothetical protein
MEADGYRVSELASASEITHGRTMQAAGGGQPDREVAMSSLSLPASRARPVAVTLAVALSALLILANLVAPALPAGAGDEQVPTVVIALGVVLGVVGIVAAVGLWLLRRWGVALTVVVTALNLLAAAPGVAFGPSAWIKALSAAAVLACIAVLLLVLLPDARRAYR